MHAHQALRKFDCECQLFFAPRDRLLQLVSLFEITIGLTLRKRKLFPQSSDHIGIWNAFQQEEACAIEALCFLDNGSALHFQGHLILLSDIPRLRASGCGLRRRFRTG